MSGRGTKKVIVAIVSALVLAAALASASPAAAEDFLSGYVSNEDSPSLTKFNTTTNEFDETLEDQLGEPGAIAVTADGTKAYVGESCNLIEPNDGTLTEVPTSQPGFFKIKITNEGCVSQIAISTKADVGDSGETVWAVIGDGAYPVDSNDESVGTPISPPEECRSGCVGEQVIQSVNDIALSPNGETLYMLYTNETIREGGERRNPRNRRRQTARLRSRRQFPGPDGRTAIDRTGGRHVDRGHPQRQQGAHHQQQLRAGDLLHQFARHLHPRTSTGLRT